MSDDIYAERNRLALAFAAAMEMHGYKVGQTVDSSEPDWPILMIDTPEGQVSWHLKADDMPDGMPEYRGEWDGHSTAEKYERLGRIVGGQYAPDRPLVSPPCCAACGEAAPYGDERLAWSGWHDSRLHRAAWWFKRRGERS